MMQTIGSSVDFLIAFANYERVFFNPKLGAIIRTESQNIPMASDLDKKYQLKTLRLTDFYGILCIRLRAVGFSPSRGDRFSGFSRGRGSVSNPFQKARAVCLV